MRVHCIVVGTFVHLQSPMKTHQSANSKGKNFRLFFFPISLSLSTPAADADSAAAAVTASQIVIVDRNVANLILNVIAHET